MSVVNFAASRVFRGIVAMLTMTAWFSISNHCVLGGLIAETHSHQALMHCHGNQPGPTKDGGEQTPCCKILKAIVAAKITADAGHLDFILREYPSGTLIAGLWQAHTPSLQLDTGPPRAVTFSESVLQRSILAHAPPPLA